MNESETICLCGNPLIPDQFIIQCNICQVFLHGGCVSIKEYMATEIDKFHCPRCEEMHGSSIMKLKLNMHRHNYSEIQAEEKPVQTGTPIFIRELNFRHFPKGDDIVKHLKGQQLTIHYLQTHGFNIPIIVDNKDGLDMTIPPSNFSVYDIERYIGGDKEMDVIDVAKQNNVRMKLKEFIEYYNDPYRSRILNLISLEFTNTGLAPLVEAPYVARKLDWVNYVWPKGKAEESEFKRPEVQKYCLVSVKDSFTDFHIDFGGTSVWYHVLRGEKIFYLIKPTSANLHLYQQWMCSSTQSETFFGDQVDVCHKYTLKQGQTMLIPTGWIHAVLTPVDSLVFGGNFLHSLNIPMQIQIYEIERKMKTPAKFQYPYFETIHWFAAKYLLNQLKDLNSEKRKCPQYFLQGLKALLSILKQWNTDKDYSMLSRSQIPETVNSQKLLKDFSKEIRHTDRFLIALNPPKPERESKRKKKKPFNKDYIDINISRYVTDTSKIKNYVNDCERRKDSLLVNKALPNRSSLKLTFSKPVIYNSESSVGNERSVPKIQSFIKTLKTFNPNVSNIKMSKINKFLNSNEIPTIKNLNQNSSINIKKSCSEMKKVSKSGNESPTIIKFRLGDKEVVRNAKDKGKNLYGNFIFDRTIETARKELTWKQTSSVYDFHGDSSESDYDGFTIDEMPKQKKCKQIINTVRKQKRPFERKVEENTVPKNGIDELLKASAYTIGALSSRIDVSSVKASNFIHLGSTSTGSNRASPSTRDAIAGMLSFSTQCYSTKKQLPKEIIATKLTAQTGKRCNEDDDDLLIENIDKVHQDNDFIYPPLDISDEDEFTFKSKNKRDDDEAWNPKVRVGPLVPKTNRPARDSVKKTSIGKGFQTAKKRKSQQSEGTKRIFNVKKKGRIAACPEISTNISSSSSSDISISTITETHDVPNNPNFKHDFTACILTSPDRLKDVKAKLSAPIPVERKLKKGMKTAKQRLGKILKIHKMLH